MGKKPIFLCLGKPSYDMDTKRNYLCPEYEECLDMAAYADHDLDCSLCWLRNERRTDLEFSAGEQGGCLALLAALEEKTGVKP